MNRPWHLTILVAVLAALVAQASPPAAVAAAWKDALTIPAGARESIRWLYVSDHLPAAERKRLWQSVSSQCNRLSREALIVPPVLILADGTARLWPAVPEADWARLVLIRVSLLDYRWDPKVWDKFGFRNILFNTVLTETVVEESVTTFATDGRTLYRRFPGEDWVLADKWVGGKTRKTTKKIVALAPAIAETAEQRGNLIGLLTALTSSKGYIPTTPIVDAQFFLWSVSQQTDRDVGYYDLPKILDQRTFERAGGYDPKADIDRAFFDEILSVVASPQSGVAIHNRRISRRRTFGGGYWLTGDNAIARDKNNPLRFVNGGFKDNAREAFIQLPNRFWLVGLFVGNDPQVAGTKEGDRQDSAPDFVGFNHLSRNNDGRIHVGWSCHACHENGGLRDIKDWYRPMLKSQKFLQTLDPKQLQRLKEYAVPLEPSILADRSVYEAALKQANGLDSKTDSKQWGDWYYGYDAGVDMERAARDAGLPLAEFSARFQKHFEVTKFADPILATWTLPKEDQQLLSVNDYAESYNLIALTIRGLSQWPDSVRQAIIVKAGGR